MDKESVTIGRSYPKDYFETLPEAKRDNMFYKRAVAVVDTGKDPMPQPALKLDEDS